MACDAMLTGRSSLIFRLNLVSLISGPKGKNLTCMANSSALRMEAVYSSETLGNFYRSIWRHVPEYNNL
jgi:hypothetical protein